MRKLKVYGGELFYHQGRQYRGVVAATSQAAAAKAMNVSLYYFREYTCDPENDLEVTAALSEPGTVFVVVGRGPDEGMVRWEDIKLNTEAPHV